MGNCQAIDAATLVIQHPSGKADKLYWPVCASEIMKANPGHYVALLISTTRFCPTDSSSKHHPTAVTAANSSTGNRPKATSTASGANLRVTRIKLLRPTDTLALGHVYRLITAQEVMKVMSAKKYAKMKKLGGQQQPPESVESLMGSDMKLHPHHLQLVGKHERQRERNHKTSPTTSSVSSNSGTLRPRTWQPSLHSISEAAS